MKTNEWLWIGLAVIGTAVTLYATREGPTASSALQTVVSTSPAHLDGLPPNTVDAEQEALRYGAMPATDFPAIVSELIRQRDECRVHYEKMLGAANSMADDYCQLHKRLIKLQQASAQALAADGYPTNGLVDELEDGCR